MMCDFHAKTCFCFLYYLQLAAELQRNMNDGLSETNGARPQSRDVNEIELCELGYPHSGQYSIVSDPCISV